MSDEREWSAGARWADNKAAAIIGAACESKGKIPPLHD